MTTLEQVKKIITDAQARELEGIEFHALIAGILKEKFAGKKITRRLLTLIKEKVGETSVVHYHEVASMLYIEMWGNGRAYDDRYHHFIGYDKDLSAYDPETFEERDGAHGKHAIDRNIQRTKLLLDTKALKDIARTIDHLNQAKTDLQKLTEDMPDRYAVEKLVQS